MKVLFAVLCFSFANIYSIALPVDGDTLNRGIETIDPELSAVEGTTATFLETGDDAITSGQSLKEATVEDGMDEEIKDDKDDQEDVKDGMATENDQDEHEQGDVKDGMATENSQDEHEQGDVKDGMATENDQDEHEREDVKDDGMVTENGQDEHDREDVKDEEDLKNEEKVDSVDTVKSSTGSGVEDKNIVDPRLSSNGGTIKVNVTRVKTPRFRKPNKYPAKQPPRETSTPVSNYCYYNYSYYYCSDWYRYLCPYGPYGPYVTYVPEQYDTRARNVICQYRPL